MSDSPPTASSFEQARAAARAVLEHVPAAVLISNQESREIVLANPAAAQLFATETADLEAMSVDALTHPLFRPELSANYARSAADQGFLTMKRYVRADETAFTGVLHALPFPLLEGHLCAVVTAVEDTDRLRAELAQAASTDPLTELLRRESFLHAADVSRSTSDRFGIVFLDLDDFKELNDAFGHDLGDQVLRVIAARIRNSARSSDLTGRFGGDEFLILAMNVESPDALARLARQLEHELEQPIDTGSGSVRVRASAGAALCAGGVSIERAVSEADAAMYRRKRERKTGVFDEFGASHVVQIDV